MKSYNTISSSHKYTPYNRPTIEHKDNKTAYFNINEIGDSDEEFSDNEKEFPVFQKIKPMLAKHMTISCKDQNQQVKNIKGSELIQITHNIIKAIYGLFKDALDDVGLLPTGEDVNFPHIYNLPYKYPITIHMSKEKYTLSFPEELNKAGNKIIEIGLARNWIIALGGWKSMIPKTEVKSYLSTGEKFAGAVVGHTTILPIIDGRIYLPKDFSIGSYPVTKSWQKDGSKWEYIDKTDLSYNQIMKTVTHIKTTYKLTDVQLANMQLYGLGSFSWNTFISYKDNGQSKDTQVLFHSLTEVEHIPIKEQIQIKIFLDYINALMFGIEATGLNIGLATGLMTLDLIKMGRITYQQAFLANENGGYYPYANHGSGKGTYNAREPVIINSRYTLKDYRKSPDKSPVAIKEAIIIKEWLKEKNKLDTSNTYNEQIIEIKKHIEALLEKYFSLGFYMEYEE